MMIVNNEFKIFQADYFFLLRPNKNQLTFSLSMYINIQNLFFCSIVWCLFLYLILFFTIFSKKKKNKIREREKNANDQKRRRRRLNNKN